MISTHEAAGTWDLSEKISVQGAVADISSTTGTATVNYLRPQLTTSENT
jgi:hypothetical protein